MQPLNLYRISKIIFSNRLIWGLILITAYACSTPETESTTAITELPTNEKYTVMIGGVEVGYMNIVRAGDTLFTDYDYKNNGRGPSIKDTIVLDAKGYPIKWDIKGTATFGNNLEEHFKLENGTATWTDATGTSSATVTKPSVYVNQFGSPYANFIQARVLLNSVEMSAPALPAGRLELDELGTLKVGADSTEVGLKTYAISGASINPTYFILDDNQQFFAMITPRYIVVRTGYESEEKNLRLLSEKYAAKRFESMQARFAHKYENGTRISNVRIFDPTTLSLTPLSSVLVKDGKISSIDGPSVVNKGETVIEGGKGVLLPGLYDMHGHMGDQQALFNVLAGVTSVRDMGNDNQVLDSLIQKIESGVLAGPRITRLGFIEGKSPFSANNGILVSSEAEAIAAVEKYASTGNFYGVKLYNSMNGDWAPAIAKRAHELGLFVCGHVPAFSNANAMLRAGYDEMTHINQVVLGWVLAPDEDTRTLLRLTALKRLPEVDLNSAKVQETLDLMIKNGAAMDPTLSIHEALLLSRNGETRLGVQDYIDHMPPNEQRNAKMAMASIENEADDKAYRGAYDKIVETLKLMKKRGITIIPGTDMGGAFYVHRELELYKQLGYTNAELLKLGSFDMARYLGFEDRGTIAPGMLADFFLIPENPIEDLKAIKTISMVSRGGVIYYPSEIYPEFGIKPFVKKPEVK